MKMNRNSELVVSIVINEMKGIKNKKQKIC